MICSDGFVFCYDGISFIQFPKGQTGAEMPCGASERANRSGDRLAELPQRQTGVGTGLRNFRKGKPERGQACGTSAKANRSKDKLAELPQR